jgi:hypothetical protein
MTVEERVARLERTCRAWRWWTTGLALALVAVLTCSSDLDEAPFRATNHAEAAAGEPDGVHYPRLRVHVLEVVNEKGQTVGVFRGRVGHPDTGLTPLPGA